MPLFWKPYTSDATDFISQLKKQDPSLETRQLQGRGLLWDRQINRSQAAEQRAARVPQQPYVYQTKV
jgi:Protein of unknown function (DUF3460)